MGVPAFFRKLIQKYKIVKNKLDILIKSLYIDANCLFHPQCFKILDKYINTTNQEILFTIMSDRIIEYINYLIKKTNPETLVYIAVDGVAPRAKINQQRMRRFGYTNNYRHEIMKKYGIKFNDSWSNIMITPGTQFMYDLHNKIREYYTNHVKNNKDPTRKYEIIYDSYMTEGEGEHKILQHIKTTDPDYNKATIIYGLDADLIFLSMSSQYPNIYLLREVIHYNSKGDDDNSGSNTIEEELCFADIDCVKQSINDDFMQKIYEFDNMKKCDDIDFTNDYIFICYFLGNDFLPHLPSIDINIDGLEMLINAYIDVYQLLGRNLITINDNRVSIDNEFLIELISLVASCEVEYFRRRLPDYLHRHKHKKCFESEKYKQEIWEIENLKNIHIKDPIKLGIGNQADWKYRYYSHYFNTDEHMQETVNSLAHNYLEGLLWVTRYYFEKCPTWSWQYKHTHAPFLSDILIYMNNKEIMTDFNTPYEEPIDIYSQLVSVIPSAYSYILPEALQYLSSTSNSPIIDMFPLTYKIDTIYKTQLYKCIPYIPYLDMKRVQSIVNKTKLSETDKKKIHKLKPIYIGKCKQTKKN
jgi:5'-3' exonuclease